MGQNVGDFYNPTIAMAARALQETSKVSPTNQLEELMMGKDDIDRRKVEERLGKFSCKEEMERYVEHCEPETMA